MIKVKLTRVTENPILAIEEAASNCYDSKPSKSGRIMKACYKNGHHSVLEFADFTFHIEGVSRALLAQLTRHRVASYAVRSQRYCSSFGVGFPPLPDGDVKTNGKQSLFDNQEKFLVKMYNEGYSTNQLEKLYHIPSTTINGIVKKYQPLRTLSETKFINKEYFSTIDSRIKAYILGFLYADGCLSIKGKEGTKQIILDQLEDEKVLLQNILYEIKPNGNVINSGHKGMARIAVQDNTLCSDLEKYGIVPNKGVTANFTKIIENVKNEYLKDVIRGVFEGDGHINVFYNDKNEINDAVFNIAGTFNTCEQIQNILVENLGLNKTKIKHNTNESYVMSYGGRQQVLKIISWLYEDINVNFLHSKKAKIIFELLPEFKKYYQDEITEIISKKYSCVIPPSYFKDIGIVNSFFIYLEEMKKTYKKIQEELACLGIYGEKANEDARFVLPNACETVLELKMNGRELIHAMNERLCRRAQWEIRELFKAMKTCIEDYSEECREFSKFLVPKCYANFPYVFCTEHESCGIAPKLEEVYKR